VLADEIEKIKQPELIAALDAGERRVAESLGGLIVAPELAPGDQQLLAPFVDWCARNSCRRCAAKPATVAAFVIHQRDSGVPPDHVVGTLAAIERLHDARRLANPVRTAIVSAVLSDERIIYDRPRSWRKEEMRDWSSLPPMIKAAITRRERERENYLRNLQNELAELRKLKPDTAKPVEQKEVITNG
jgi:hypothetical protein